MKNLITKDGLERLNQKLEEKIELLKRTREEKAHAYNVSGDGWHDNPGWIQIGQQEDQLVNDIVALKNRVSNAVIAQLPDSNNDSVQLGSRVEFHFINLVTGLERIQILTIVGAGESDTGNGKISYDSPIGEALYKMRTGEEKLIELPAGKVRVVVKKISHE